MGGAGAPLGRLRIGAGPCGRCVTVPGFARAAWRVGTLLACAGTRFGTAWRGRSPATGPLNVQAREPTPVCGRRVPPLAFFPQDGQFRWNRLENLMREGSKSQDFDPSQLWLLAEWLLTPGAKGVRDSVVVEVARMVDAVAAGDVRERIVQR